MRRVITLAAAVSALALASSASAATSGNYCLKAPSGKLICKYHTMAACKKAHRRGESCVAKSAAKSGSTNKASKSNKMGGTGKTH